VPLARFIRANAQQILLGWDEFAATMLDAKAARPIIQ